MDLRDRARYDAHRRTRRRATKLEGSLREREQPETVEIVDLSHGGCLVRSQRRHDRDRVVDIVLHVTPQPIHAKARVADCSHDGAAPAEQGPLYLCGLEFLTLSAEDAEALRCFLRDASGSGEASA